jgi:hypothetical protein
MQRLDQRRLRCFRGAFSFPSGAASAEVAQARLSANATMEGEGGFIADSRIIIFLPCGEGNIAMEG